MQKEQNWLGGEGNWRSGLGIRPATGMSELNTEITEDAEVRRVLLF